jgi:hypothetical protein
MSETITVSDIEKVLTAFKQEIENKKTKKRIDDEVFLAIKEAKEHGLSWPVVYRIIKENNLTDRNCWETLRKVYSEEVELRKQEEK